MKSAHDRMRRGVSRRTAYVTTMRVRYDRAYARLTLILDLRIKPRITSIIEGVMRWYTMAVNVSEAPR